MSHENTHCRRALRAKRPSTIAPNSLYIKDAGPKVGDEREVVNHETGDVEIMCFGVSGRWSTTGVKARKSGPPGPDSNSRPGYPRERPPNPAQGKDCLRCGKKNHFARDCRSVRDKDGKWIGKPGEKEKGVNSLEEQTADEVPCGRRVALCSLTVANDEDFHSVVGDDVCNQDEVGECISLGPLRIFTDDSPEGESDDEDLDLEGAASNLESADLNSLHDDEVDCGPCFADGDPWTEQDPWGGKASCRSLCGEVSCAVPCAAKPEAKDSYKAACAAKADATTLQGIGGGISSTRSSCNLDHDFATSASSNWKSGSCFNGGVIPGKRLNVEYADPGVRAFIKSVLVVALPRSSFPDKPSRYRWIMKSAVAPQCFRSC